MGLQLLPPVVISHSPHNAGLICGRPDDPTYTETPGTGEIEHAHCHIQLHKGAQLLAYELKIKMLHSCLLPLQITCDKLLLPKQTLSLLYWKNVISGFLLCGCIKPSWFCSFCSCRTSCIHLQRTVLGSSHHLQASVCKGTSLLWRHSLALPEQSCLSPPPLQPSLRVWSVTKMPFLKGH